MLVFGLAFMATPVMAVPYIDASFSTNWTVNIEYPVGDGDGEDEVGIGAGVIAPDSPKLTDDGSSGITEITLTDMTYVGTAIMPPSVYKSDRTKAATTIDNAAWVRYTVTLRAGTNTATPNTMTLDGYHTVTFPADPTVTPSIPASRSHRRMIAKM